MPIHRMSKVKVFPRPHNMIHSLAHDLDSVIVNQWGIYPLIMYDEGLGAPSGYKANTENAAFVDANEPNCFPESKIDNIFCRLEMSLAKKALTDNITGLKMAFMPIMLAFKEDYTPADELTGVKIQDILEMTTESTDRQGYPLWNTVDFGQKFTGSDLLAANVPALTATQRMESIAFDLQLFYDALQYYTISDKLRACVGGMKWVTLTRNRPIRTFDINIKRKNKYMNPHNFYGLMIGCEVGDTHRQIATAADVTTGAHAYSSIITKYFEWHGGFDMERV